MCAIGPNGRFESAGDLAFFQHQLLLSSSDKHLVVRIDPKTRHVVKKVKVAGLTPRAVAVAGQTVWVADPGV